MPFALSFEFIYRYWNQLHTQHENLLSIPLESEQKQGGGINAVHCNKGIYLSVRLYLIISLCLFA